MAFPFDPWKQTAACSHEVGSTNYYTLLLAYQGCFKHQNCFFINLKIISAITFNPSMIKFKRYFILLNFLKKKTLWVSIICSICAFLWYHSTQISKLYDIYNLWSDLLSQYMWQCVKSTENIKFQSQYDWNESPEVAQAQALAQTKSSLPGLWLKLRF